MALFDVPVRAGREQDINTLKKSKTTVKGTSSKVTITSQIASIKAFVDKVLGKYRDVYELINTEQQLESYINDCIKFGEVAIDTETTGLDPMLDKIVGFSLYTPNRQACYVPINHISYVTGIRVDNQLTENQITPILQKLVEYKTKIIMFNANFDIRVIRNQLKVYLNCDWDCYLGARCLNENEGEGNNKLKKLHMKYVLKNEEDEFSYEEMFKGITFDKIPIDYAYLYGAHDAIITYEYYQFQKPYLDINQEREDLRNVAWVFHNIEMPCVKVVCDMEDTGVEFDIKYCNELSSKYHKLLDEKINNFYSICEQFSDQLNDYRIKQGISNKLDNPINISSSTQIAIVLYDILGIEPVDSKNVRGTGDDILSKIEHPISKAIVEYREVKKLITTYIDKLPNCINQKTGRIHCNYNQYGADTGRFSSTNPNLQNIPSHNKEIRKMFKATDGYVMMSSDYSQQEVKVMAQMCGDEKMLEAFRQGKDFYAQIASIAFNRNYEDCLEFNKDGTTNKEGKERRTQAKSILLGINYGRGVASIAEQLKCEKEKAQQIKDSVFKGFPAIPKFEKESKDMAKYLGYVTTLWGRKRRLPDMSLPEYEFYWKDGVAPDNDVLDFDDNIVITEVPDNIKNEYLNKLHKAKFWDKKNVIQEASVEGIRIVDNGSKIANAERQCVNARIQGSAADLSKLAMIKVGTDDRLRELGFRLLIPVHDELIGECPIENAKECKERFAHLMEEAAVGKLTIPISCDVASSYAWYGEEVMI